MRLKQKSETLISIGEMLRAREGSRLSINFTNGSMRYTELIASEMYHYQTDTKQIEISAMVHFTEPNTYKVISIDTNTINLVLEKFSRILSNPK